MANKQQNEICSLGSETLRLHSELRATGEEMQMIPSTGLPIPGNNGTNGPNPKGSPLADDRPRKGSLGLKDRSMKIGTWNVRTMNRAGKLENVKEEMRRNKLNILGLSEMRWKGNGDFISEQFRVIYAGGEDGQRGVGIVLDSDAAKRVGEIERFSERMIMVKVQAEPVNMVVIQLYMPTSDHKDEEVELMYEKLEEILATLKGTDYVVIMGDWNAVVGEGRDEKEVGSFGLGQRNERGERLVEFCKKNKFVATNTWFKQEKRRRYTWKKPGDTERYQLDYILVRQRYRNSVKGSWSYPGADIDSDHNLVAMSINVKLKKITKGKRRQKWDLCKLKANEEAFRTEVEGSVTCEEGGTTEERWKKLKRTVMESAVKHVGFERSKIAKKPWVTQEMLESMEARRKWKNKNTEEGKKNYRKLNNELQRETEKAKQKWWENECKELEELDSRGRSDLVYAKVKQLTWKDKSAGRSTAIKDLDGNLLTEPEEVRKRWKDYVESLYDKEGKPKPEEMQLECEDNIGEDFKGPEVLESEILAAIKEMKNKKAVGVDEIPAEFWKVIGEKGIRELVSLCKEMYQKGVWPEDFTRVVIIPLPKKENAVDCGDHRTISLISHASKIMLKILTKRIEAKVRDFIGRNQFGFRREVGTRDAIGVMRMLCERSLENGNDVYICFVDFEKAFDRVDWIRMLKILKDLGVDWRDRRMINELYMKQEAVVRVADGESEPGVIGRGVRQGCPLSPLLFSIYVEMMMIEAFEDSKEGIRVGGELVRDVRFADDQGMVESTEIGLQMVMNKLKDTAQRYNMKINVAKTKAMVVSKKGGSTVTIMVDGKRIEQVKKFKYLGATLTEDGKCLEDVKGRIAAAKNAFNNRKELLTKRMSKAVKKRIIKSLIWSVALYGCETWTLREEEIGKLNAFEMWTWRRMERVSWKDKKTNEEVLREVGEDKKLVEMIVRRKKNWIGHILRGNGLLKQVIEGRMEGKRARGRPRKGMIDDLKEGSYVHMKRRAEDRQKWRVWMPRTCSDAEN